MQYGTWWILINHSNLAPEINGFLFTIRHNPASHAPCSTRKNRLITFISTLTHNTSHPDPLFNQTVIQYFDITHSPRWRTSSRGSIFFF